MKPDEFEQSLQRQPVRQIPPEWREQILDAAVPEAKMDSPRPSPLVPRPSVWWRELLWPCPQVWAGLAAAWVFIVLMNFQSGEQSARALAKESVPSKELLLALREQRRALERSIEFDEQASEPPKRFVPRPRSEGSRPIAMG